MSVSETLKPEFAIRKLSVASWAVYDLGNTLFMMGVVSMLFQDFARAQFGEEGADSHVTGAQAIAAGIIFVLSPFLGALTDYSPRRVPYLAAATLLCIGFTMLMGIGGFNTTALFFVLAYVTFQASVQFYDALLPDVSTDKNRSKVSGSGVAVGFIGSYVAVGIVGVTYSLDWTFHQRFIALALMFLLFAWPAFFFIRERPRHSPMKFSLKLMRTAAADTSRTLRALGKYPGVARFLIGRALYTDAANTVAIMMTLFTMNLAEVNQLSESEGQAERQKIYAIAITFSIIGGFLWGRIAHRIGPKKALNRNLGVWLSVCLLATSMAFFVPSLWLMYLLAILAGIGLAGNPSTDRPLLVGLAPQDKVGEFFGLYAMVGRFSAIIGPLIWGALYWVGRSMLDLSKLQSQGLGTLFLALMVVAGAWVLKPIQDPTIEARSGRAPTPV